MKIRVLVTGLLSCTLMTAPLVQSAPNGDRVQQVIKYKSYYDSLWASFYDGNVSLNVSGNVYDDFSGAVSTSLYAGYYNEATGESWSISCNFPTGGNEVSINQVNKDWVLGLKGTLDPADEKCVATNVAAPIVINMSGQATHDYRNSSTGHGKSMSLGETWKYANKSYQFSADMTGTVNSMDGPWGGSVSTSRNYNIQKIK